MELVGLDALFMSWNMASKEINLLLFYQDTPSADDSPPSDISQ